MQKNITRLPSCDGVHELAVYEFIPEEPRAVLQLVHGMAEHIGRYEPFARFLGEHGIACVGHDHLGHGLSVKSSDELGYIADKGGADLLIEDAVSVTRYISQKFDLPVILFGHSMGSLVCRNYISRDSSPLSGCLLCGNVQDTLAAAPAVTGLVAAFGKRRVSRLLNAMAFGAYMKRIPHPRTQFDWLSVNEDNVDAYIADELSGFSFKAKAMNDLATLNARVSGKGWVEGIRKDLPIYLFSGEDDPCGGWGEGVKRIFERLEDAGIESVSLTLYPDMRHEILNETDSARVMEDMLAAINEILEEDEDGV